MGEITAEGQDLRLLLAKVQMQENDIKRLGILKFVSTSSESFGSTVTSWVKLMNSVGGAVFRAPEPGTRVLLLTVQVYVSKTKL